MFDQLDTLDTYRDELEHVARPSHAVARDESPSITLSGYEALLYVEALAEYASYHAADPDDADIATAAAQYLDHMVRGEGKRMIDLYAHTPEAGQVLIEATSHTSDDAPQLAEQLTQKVDSLRLQVIEQDVTGDC